MDLGPYNVFGQLAPRAAVCRGPGETLQEDTAGFLLLGHGALDPRGAHAHGFPEPGSRSAQRAAAVPRATMLSSKTPPSKRISLAA